MSQISLEDLELEPDFQPSTRVKNLIGQTKGNFTIIKFAGTQNSRSYWWGQCLCGNIEKFRSDSSKTMCQECQNKIRSEKAKGRGMVDLSQQKFGKLTPIAPLEERHNNKVVWRCICDCGTECQVLAASLTSGNTQSCGCLKKENTVFAKAKNKLVGQTYGYLTVLEETDQRQYGKIVWKCQCECGNIVYLNTTRLKSGNDTSCGCKKRSLGALRIENILNKNQIIFTKEYIASDLPNRRFDFAIYNKNKLVRLIEYDGEQHFRSSGGWNSKEYLEITKKRDKIKNEYALSHNIPLVRIPYWERDNITLEMLMGDQYLITENK